MADDPTTPEEVYGDPDAETGEDEPKASQPWLDLITQSDKAGFKDYHDRADKVDKLYADAERLANKTRDAEFQIFWANIEVLKPSIYSRPPVPVVVPRFQDRRPLQQVSSELLERSVTVTFDQERIDEVMKEVRDDLAILARGVAWVRYETKDGKAYATEAACIEWVSRRDFAHDAARTWKEVDWVAKRSWLTKAKMKDRFEATSQSAYEQASYQLQKDEHGNNDGKETAGVWELWCKSANRVVWVTEGVDVVLDNGAPHLTLQDFFPCPQPAFGTLQRGSLIPVPDFVYYQDQISEINALTNRIASLSEALKLKGFYPAGAAELSDAIEAAVKNADDKAILVPISNWAVTGGNANQMIVWLPIQIVAETITQLVTLRKQLIDDVYQITGISDIMRGDTEASETLGAQQLKSEYGSVRIKDRTDELVRFAKDITRLVAEIISENFSPKTLLDMTQLPLPSNADIEKQVGALTLKQKQLTDTAKQVASNPQAQQAAQQNPDQAKAAVGQVQGQLQQIGQQIDKLKSTPTIEQVMALLREQSVRPFVLDIETDSTIAPDENAQKQRATEFITAVGGFMGQAIPLVEQLPQAAPLFGEMLKYIAGQFRAGRQLEGVIDQFADQMEQQSGQQKGPSPEAQAMQAKSQADMQAHQADMRSKQQAAQISEASAHQSAMLAEQESAAKIKATELGMQQAAQKHAQDMQAGALELEALKAKTAAALAPTPDANAQKPPAEVMAFKDMPPEGKVQMAAQAGITLTPEGIAANDAAQAAATAATKGTPAPAAGAKAPAKAAAPAAKPTAQATPPAAPAAPAPDHAAMLKRLMEDQAAPVQLIKDASGNNVAVKRGSITKRIVRHPQTGEAMGLQ